MSDKIEKEEEELFKLFIDESKEHLDGIEADLLAIEKNGKNIDIELVNKVFRAVHSLKGTSGFFGLEKLKNLSHAMENILGLIRKKELIPESEVISLLLDGADVLVGMINTPDTINEVEISSNLEKLNNLLVKTLPEDKQLALEEKIKVKNPNGRTIFSVSSFELEKAITSEKGGKFIYLIEYDLIRDIQRKSKNPYGIISELLEFTALIDSKLDIEAVGTLNQFSDSIRIPFYVLLSTLMNSNIIVDFLEIDKNKTWRISYDSSHKQTDCQADNKKQKLEETQKVDTPPVSTPKAAKDSKPSKTSVRVNLNLLDTLMVLAGELVLTRNQLIRSVSDENFQQTEKITQHVDQITTELQDAIMSTRMQSIDIVFNKFQRIVRDLSKDLGKSIKLILEGEHVELDKTIIESINDPLSHLVRNSVDHGIELPGKRLAKGKPAEGTLRLSAFHKAGQVVIEIEDDGKGIDPKKIKEKALSMNLYSSEQLDSMADQALMKLIFTPGFSTAEKVTDISGRGVGMDVVNSNITKLGGVIDLDSILGERTTITIKLPLTLTIIPCLMLSEEGEEFAIPQANLLELQRIPGCAVKEKIEKIGDVNVMRRRGELLPLVRLRDILSMQTRTFIHPKTGERLQDRRASIADLRFQKSDEQKNGSEQDSIPPERQDHPERTRSAVNIAIVAAGDFHYGIVVEGLQDSSEIVVKPLGCHLRECRAYAGATILGNGRAALILDVMSISQMIKNDNAPETKSMESLDEQENTSLLEDKQTLLLVENGENDSFAVPLGLVERIEKININQVMTIGGQRTMQYRGESLMLFKIENAAKVAPLKKTEKLYVIIYRMAEREMGLLVSNLIDILESNAKIDEKTHNQPGIFGSLLINDRITLMVDPQGIASHIVPDLAVKKGKTGGKSKKKQRILIVDDSMFFLKKIQSFIEDAGYQALTAKHGLEALEVLESNEGKIDLVLTDIEMPELDGFGLSERIRENDRFRNIPIVAITSLMGETAEEKGREAGIDEYLIKLDKDQIVKRSEYFLKHGRA